MSDGLGWIAVAIAVLLTVVLPIYVSRWMKSKGWEAWSAIWLTGGSSAAGIAIMYAIAVDGRPPQSAFEGKILFCFLWWLYMALAIEAILSHWRK